VASQPGDWADFADAAAAVEFINAIVYDFRGLLKEFIPAMDKQKMMTEHLAWICDQLLKTPNYAAALLAVDGSFADYSAEARMIDGKIGVLNIVSEAQATTAKAWLAKNAPHSEIAVLGNHLMLMEFHDQFNMIVDAFLQKVESQSLHTTVNASPT
jgi:hypothetical protein